MKYSKDIYSKQNSVLQITSVPLETHFEISQSLRVGEEWAGSGEKERSVVTGLKKDSEGNSAKGQSCKCLEVFKGGDHCRWADSS